MVITHELTMDLNRRGVTPVVDAVQGDSNTRAVKLTLTAGGAPFSPPAGVTASVAFRKPDGKKGWYDKLPDGTAACFVTESMITAMLAPEVLTAAGPVDAVLILQDEDLNQLATFGFTVQVAKNPAAGITVSNDYYNYTTMAEINAAMDDFFTKAEKDWVAFEEEIRTSANTAAEAAIDARDAARAAATNANNAATEANDAVTAANTATTKAEEATVAANNAASVAEAATEETIAARDSFLEAAGESMQAIVDLLGAAVDGPAVVCEETGSVIAVGDASNRIVQGLTLYGKTTQDGTPTPESPVELVSAGNGGSIRVTVTDGTVSNVQALTAQTSNGLPGIPVTSGGNYTDENGQQWICDEIDFARGVYVKRIVSKVLNASELWNTYASTEGYLSFRHKIGELGYGVDDAVLCDKLQHAPSLANANKVAGIRVLNSSAYNCFHVFLRLPAEYMDGITNVTTFKQWLAENPLTVLYALAEPVETPLSAEELAQYAALHTNKPNTTVMNDAGAGMKLAYVADTKLYIDKKFNELAAAIVNNA